MHPQLEKEMAGAGMMSAKHRRQMSAKTIQRRMLSSRPMMTKPGRMMTNLKKTK